MAACMKTLVFWGRPGPPPAGQPPERVYVARLADYLDEAARDRIDEAAMAWTKAFGRRPLLDGRSLRELAAVDGLSLWWFAELFLHHSTDAPRFVRLIEAFGAVLDREAPDEAEETGLPREEAVLLQRVCARRGVLFHGRARAARGRSQVLRLSLESRWNTFKTAATALKAVLAGAPPLPSPGARVVFLSHAAFWRRRKDGEGEQEESFEHYFDRIIPAVAQEGSFQPFVLAVGPRAAFRRRGARARLREWLRPHPRGSYVHVNRYASLRVVRKTLRATREVRALWRALRRSPALREAFSHDGVSFADLSEGALAGTLLLQLPWAVRSMEEMAAVLAATRPAALCLYAESSGWGRAAIAACRRAGVPTVAVQHGIVYPKYFSYRHEEDEGDCPRPDRTAVFGESARRLLQRLGRYAEGSLVVTGSPKFDALAEAARSWDRAALRARLGLAPPERVLVVASRFRPIRDTHHAIGAAFAGLVRAVEALPGARCLVKPHPAEAAEGYAAVLGETGAERTRVLPPGTDLLELLFAADALVTVESLAAVEAVVLGRPVVVLEMPTHLEELVEAGVALGVGRGEDPQGALEAVLFDEATRGALARARGRYLSELAMGLDGGSTARIVAVIRQTAGGGGVTAS
jgi:surface carbohydrate biosynthesis protein (TIGR04326 family)